MRHPIAYVRKPPYNWTPWTLLYPLAHLIDGVVALISFGFLDTYLVPTLAEKSLRHALDKRRARANAR